MCSTLTSLLLLLLSTTLVQAKVDPSLSCSSAGICFASGLSTGAVLQRSPERAALYGSLTGTPGSKVTLLLSSVDGSYRKVFNTTASSDLTWKVLLDPMATGGNFTATVTCTGGCTGRTSKTITDLTWGDVVFCSGQSNAWLPLWFTRERNHSLASVLAGNYSNIRLWRGGLGKIEGPTHSGNWVADEGIEPGSDGSDLLTNQWSHPYDVAQVILRPGEPWFFEFPSTCWYTAQYLTDLLGAADAPPFGLMTVPVGGTMAEEWTSLETQATCSNVTCMCMGGGGQCDPYQPLDANCTGNSALWWGNVQPFVNITLRHMWWYQGENNLQYDLGNSLLGTGYSCLFPALIAAWRSIWSVVPGTTNPLIPFGFVELADGTDEAWGLSMAGLRYAQTGGWGTVPNPAMPNTYRALAHDAGDPWDADGCATPNSCCVPEWQALGPKCLGDHRGDWDWFSTNWFMGQVHPRPKAIIGQRLAQACYATAYDGPLPAKGPQFTGCTVSSTTTPTLTITFNATALMGAPLQWSPTASIDGETTALYVLPSPLTLPANAGENHHSGDWRSYQGPFAGGNEVGVQGWVAVNGRVGGGGGEGSTTTLEVDLSPLGGVEVTAIRYAWGTGGWGAPFLTRMCTGTKKNCNLEPCEIQSCPLQAGGLPGEPFLAEIKGGKCVCLPPQVC